MTAPTSPASGALPALPDAVDGAMDCEDCGGHGFVGEPMYQGEFQPPEHERCQSCDGSGRWSIKAFTEDQMHAYALAALASQEATEEGYAKAFYEIASALGIGARADTPENVFRNEMLPKIKLMAEVFGDKYCADCRRTKGADPAAALASPQVAPAPVPDPLQGAADWIKAGLTPCTASDIAGRLLIGYNRALRLFSGAAPAPVAPTPTNEWNDAIEAAAKRIENGSFLHDQAPAKLFANEVAPVLRSMKRAAPVAPTPAQPSEDACIWTYDEDQCMYETSCDQAWSFTDGGPQENHVRFCHYCAKRVEVATLPPEPEGEAK